MTMIRFELKTLVAVTTSKFLRSVITLLENKELELNNSNHVISFHQSHNKGFSELIGNCYEIGLWCWKKVQCDQMLE